MKRRLAMNRNLLRTCSLAAQWSSSHLVVSSLKWPKLVRSLSTSSVRRFMDARDKDHAEKEKQLVVHQGEYFDVAGKAERNKRTFQQAMKLYLKHNAIYRRGHVEFLYAALDRMKEFDVHRDLDTYKQLLTLFPEGKMIARGPWEVEWMYYPKQQQCAIDIMDMMESHGNLVLFVGHIMNIHLHSCKHKTVTLKLTLTLTLTDTGGAVLTLMLRYRRLRIYKLKRKIQN